MYSYLDLLLGLIVFVLGRLFVCGLRRGPAPLRGRGSAGPRRQPGGLRVVASLFSSLV